MSERQTVVLGIRRDLLARVVERYGGHGRGLAKAFRAALDDAVSVRSDEETELVERIREAGRCMGVADAEIPTAEQVRLAALRIYADHAEALVQESEGRA